MYTNYVHDEIMYTMKTCRTCKQEKPLSEYHFDVCMSDKRKPNCKTCCAIQRKKWDDKKKESVTTQRCTKCKGIKSLNMFETRIVLEDGTRKLKRTCKKCSEKYQPWGYTTKHINWIISTRLA